jgi:hypothetical protein
MPWKGPDEIDEWPTLGYEVADWIESHCVIPDGHRKGEPYRLTDEQLRFIKNFYRLYPHAAPWPALDGLRYTGAQFRRSQKHGKDPLGAAIILAESLGPTNFAGWNAAGEAVGRPYPTPLIACLGTSEEQTDNTWRPLVSMAQNGPLADMPGLDVGLTRIILPSGGKIEPVTTSARARLGAPMTFVTITESHLFALQGGFRKVAGAVKRNVAGMDGRWLELTNAWDPTEGSEAQVTASNPDERTLIDTIEPRRVEDLDNDEELYAELLRQYGDSARERGGWVNVKGRIFGEARSAKHMEADRRRFFLNEIVVGQSVFVDPIRWDVMAKPETLAAGEKIALGFDGAKYQDATALIAARMSDGKLFQLRIWERPKVDQVLRATFDAYDVVMMFADPYRWQDYLDAWSGQWPKQVVEFPTNVERRMDAAIERFTTAFNGGKLEHDGSETLTKHAKNAVLVKGSKKRLRPGEDEDIAQYYLKMAKRGTGQLIDAGVAAVLAYAARGQAIEDGALNEGEEVEAFAMWLDV